MTLHTNFVLCLVLGFISSYYQILANKNFDFFKNNLRGVDTVFDCFLFY